MPNPPPPADVAPRRLLVRGVNWLGDSVMTTPALQRLREFLPEAHISLLAPGKLAELWRGHPSVNAVLSFERSESPWCVANRLRSEGFDCALVLPNSPRAALEVWLAGIPRRIGYARPWRNWFLTARVAPRAGRVRMRKRSVREIHRLVRATSAGPSLAPRGPSSSAHQLHEYLHLAAALGASAEPLPPRLAVDAREVQAAASKFGLDASRAGDRPLLALNPGAEYGPAKRWPTDRFVAVAREVQKRTRCAWLLLGGESDVPLANEIYSALSMPTFELQNLAGKTSLRELMALVKLCRALLTNDSGPMHVAAALATPVVVPFGSTSPELTGPGLPGDAGHRLLRAEVPCAPCFRRSCPIDFRCMTGISVEQVVAAVMAAVTEHR